MHGSATPTGKGEGDDEQLRHTLSSGLTHQECVKKPGTLYGMFVNALDLSHVSKQTLHSITINKTDHVFLLQTEPGRHSLRLSFSLMAAISCMLLLYVSSDDRSVSLNLCQHQSYIK